MKILMWVLSIVALLLSGFFGMWAIQAVWLSGFASGDLVHVYAVRFYIRGGLTVLFLILSIVLGYRAKANRRK